MGAEITKQDCDKIAEIIERQGLIQESFEWMLKDIKHRAFATSGGNFSDELLLAIDNGKWLEQFKENK